MAKREPKLIQALERGIAGLEMAIASGEVKPQELAEVLGVDRTTAYRLLHTLAVKGYLNQDPTSRTFVANPTKFFLLSSQVAGSLNWLTVVTAFLKTLRDQTGETANLAVMHDHEMVCIAQEHALETPTVLYSLGARRAVHCSATGKSVIAILPDDELDRLIREKGLARFTPKTITHPETLRLDLKGVRARGYAIDDEETFENVRCIASPVYDHTHRIVAAIGISGPSTLLTRERISDLAKVVLRIAKETSAALGADGLPRSSDGASDRAG